MAVALPPADLWLPSRPAIIRPAEHSLLRPGAFRPVSRAERCLIIADLVRSGRMTRDEALRAAMFVPIVAWKAGGADLSYTHTATGGDGSVVSTLTITNAAIGTAASDRTVVVTIGIIGSNQTHSITNVTFGGSGGTQAVGAASTPGNDSGVFIWHRLVTSGTTCTIVITSQFSGRIMAHVGTIRGSTALSVVDTKQYKTTSGNGAVSSFNIAPVIAAGQVAVIGGFQGGSDTTIGWTNATEAAETAAANETNLGTAYREDSSATVTCSFGKTAAATGASATFAG